MSIITYTYCKRAIFAFLFVFVLTLVISCAPGSMITGDVERLPPQLPGVELKLSASFAPLGSATYPLLVVREASPVVLRFSFAPHVITKGTSCVQIADIGMPKFYENPLYELRYSLQDDDGYKFFEDKVDLYGQKAPGDLEVVPGVYISVGTKNLVVKATLHYQKILFDHKCTVTGYANAKSNVATLNQPVTQSDDLEYRYSDFIDGFFRRHLLNIGRGLSSVWLKEYEPGRDRKELLYHSRINKVPGDHTRVYVPWFRQCHQNELDKCGPSVFPTSDIIYGAGENPLLHGGLAMATFAQQALHEWKRFDLGLDREWRARININRALKLLEYFEKSEWRYPDGRGSGFFLRSRQPGNKEHARHYFYASIDEIVGMTLGLLKLNEALKIIGPNSYSDERERLIDLTWRLGNQLKNHYYLLYPPEDSNLPKELHKGWAGGYMLQWFLAGGFREITWDKYHTGFRPLDPQLRENHSTISYLASLTNRSPEGLSYIAVPVSLNLNAHERAVLTIQGTGIAMFHGGLLNHLPLIDSKFNRFNYVMLLHAFQLGMADASRRDEDAVNKIKEKMAILIRGVLGNQVIDKIDPVALSLGIVSSTLGDVIDFTTPDVPIAVGTMYMEDDYYAAAVARVYHLPNYLPWWWLTLNTVPLDYITSYNDLIDEVIARTKQDFTVSLPVGERHVSGVSVLAHNPPPRRIGQDFVWEHYPHNPYQGGGKENGSGLPDDEIRAIHERDYDTMKEGAGLGYLLPTAMLDSSELDHTFYTIRSREIPLLGGCFTLPRTAAQINPDGAWDGHYDGYRTEDEPCYWSFGPEFAEDQFDLGELDNDSYINATPLEWGYTGALSIDKETHTAYLDTEYATYVKDPFGNWPAVLIPREADYDYYKLDNPEKYDVQLYVNYLFDNYTYKNKKLVVDGKEIMPEPPDPSCGPTPPNICQQRFQMTLKGKLTHTVMVTGGTGNYSMQIGSLPIANSQRIITDEDTPTSITLKGRDRENRPLTFSIVQHPQKGTLSGAPPNVIYTPESNFTGIDRFSFITNIGVYDSLPAEIKISMTPVNDPPIAYSQSLITLKDEPIEVVLTASDPDDQQLTYTIIQQPEHGAATKLHPDSPIVLYSPKPGYEGFDQFSFRASDGKLPSEPETIAITIISDRDIRDINLFFDKAVSDGTLVGSPARLYAIRVKLDAAHDSIEVGNFEEACEYLLYVLKRADALPLPEDFVSGEATAEFTKMIRDLRTKLGCP